jgi:hypothetical protein
MKHIKTELTQKIIPRNITIEFTNVELNYLVLAVGSSVSKQVQNFAEVHGIEIPADDNLVLYQELRKMSDIPFVI